TASAPLPGGDLNVNGVAALAAELRDACPFLTAFHASRLAHAYGTQARSILDGATSMADLGRDFGATLTEREVRHLMTREWARDADDVVWRRSKLGLRMSAAEIAALDAWMASAAAAVERAL
ncbi:MAG: glycerol-3-phosphate dehydrogenase C-terminal domain-containing protein, partial [Xanthobacteraceae bacterium]